MDYQKQDADEDVAEEGGSSSRCRACQRQRVACACHSGAVKTRYGLKNHQSAGVGRGVRTYGSFAAGSLEGRVGVARRGALPASSFASSPLVSSSASHASSSASSSYATVSGSNETSASESRSAAATVPTARQDSYMLFHPQYDLKQVEKVKPAHRAPKDARDYVAYGLVQIARWSFDKLTGYTAGQPLSRDAWLNRFIFLETVAGVPGMVGAMLRHMMSLRTLRRDHGWIHTLLEEAENERMHLLTFLKLREPEMLFRLAVLGAQGVFFNAFFLSYLISPRTCHRFVGYLEEEAVRTYTHAIHDIDGDGDAALWATTPAPKLAIQYWRMPQDATVRDLIIAVRADEASHSHVNHTLSSMGTRQANPFHVGHTDLPENFVEPPAGFVPEHCR